ncbi:MAG: lytic transglycosylase domain-containing protein [Sulfurimonas sp.]|jgi:soluble lytic murein transglycosylase-like protein
MKILLILSVILFFPAGNFASSDYGAFFDEAGKYYNINPSLLNAIAKTESNINPDALNCANSNQSCDYGIMQINAVHLPKLKKYGISKEDLLKPRINIFVGAWVLKNCINKNGTNFKALNCYNGKIENNNYFLLVLKNYEYSKS